MNIQKVDTGKTYPEKETLWYNQNHIEEKSLSGKWVVKNGGNKNGN